MAESIPERVEFLVIGECLADIVRTPGRPDHPHPGGSPANVAYGLARLGRRTALLTQIGQDGTGELLRSHLAGAGVHVLTDGQACRTSTAIVTLDAQGRADYEFAIGWTLGRVGLPAADHVHLGSLASVMEPGATTARGLLRELHAAGATVSYDPNIRPALFGERVAGIAAVEECVALSHVVKASDEDLEWLYPGVPPRASAARWLTLGPGVVIVTCGGDGAFALTADGEAHAEAPEVQVVDTVGAGDSFMSAVLASLADHAPLPTALATAVAAAAVTVSRAGANPPSTAELTAALSGPAQA